jgi:hypothetical protein
VKKSPPPIQDKPQPHNAEMEQGLLGSIMVSRGAVIPQCRKAGVEPGWFFVPAHAIVFQQACDAYDADKPIELLPFTARLRAKKLLAQIGGAGFITELFGFVPTADNLDYYVGIVRDYYIARQTIRAGYEAARRVYDLRPENEGNSPLPLLDQLQSSIVSIRSLGRDGATPGRLPMIEDAAALISKPIIPPEPVIEGIAHHGEKLAIGGASKAFKTWILSDLAISVSSGGLWLGHFQCTRGKVLHINFELLPAYFTQRLRTVADENQVTLENDYLHVWNLRGFACDFAMLLPKILERIGNVEYSLIILDPIYKLLGRLRQENVAGDIADLLNQTESLAVKTNAAVAYGQHYSKGNQAKKEAIDRVAGSGVFARDPDSLVNFTRLKQEDCFSVEITMRHHPPVKPFGVRWQYPVLISDVSLDPFDLKTAGRPRVYDDNELLELIDEKMRAGQIVKMAKEEIGWPERQTYESLRRLKAENLLKQPQPRGPYERA